MCALDGVVQDWGPRVKGIVPSQYGGVFGSFGFQELQFRFLTRPQNPKPLNPKP